jgi:hypothetical protein
MSFSMSDCWKMRKMRKKRKNCRDPRAEFRTLQDYSTH